MLMGMWRNHNPGTLLAGMQHGAARMVIVQWVLKKLKNRIKMSFNDSPFGHISKRIESRISGSMCTPTFEAVLFTIAKKGLGFIAFFCLQCSVSYPEISLSVWTASHSPGALRHFQCRGPHL